MDSSCRLSHYFSDTLPGVVWRIVIDGSVPQISLEIRNPEKKLVSFWGIDLTVAQWKTQDLTLDEKWWLSLDAVVDDSLVLTWQQDPHNLESKALIVTSLKSRQISWWKPDFSFQRLQSKTIVGFNKKFGIKETLAIETGESLKPLEHPKADNFLGIYPFQYKSGTPHFHTVETFLIGNNFDRPLHVIEYLEYSGLIFISFFRETKGLQNVLLVCDSGGDIVLNETLGEDLKGIASDTFFIYAGFLIFVKNKCELVCYKTV